MPGYPTRSFLTHPGEALTVQDDINEMLTREQLFTRYTGIPVESVHISPLIAVPVPVYPADSERRRWAGTHPEAMWHPLMWLPEKLQKVFELEPGRHETLDEWALRVLFSLDRAGLYDQDTGQWVDLLQPAGIDVENPDDIARIQTWLDGAPDPILDGIDLTSLFEETAPEGNPDWALVQAVTVEPIIRQRATGAIANNLVELLTSPYGSDGEPLPEAGLDSPGIVQRLTAVLTIAHTFCETGTWEWNDHLRSCKQLADTPDTPRDTIVTFYNTVLADLLDMAETLNQANGEIDEYMRTNFDE